MTTENPGRSTQYVFALSNDQLLVIRADNLDLNKPGQGSNWHNTFRAHLGREGEPMDSIGQARIDSGRDGKIWIETGAGRVYAPAPWLTGERPTWNGEPIEALNVKDWDVTEHDDGTATAVRLPQD